MQPHLLRPCCCACSSTRTEPRPAPPAPSETPGAWATTTSTSSTDDPKTVEWTESILAVNERKGAERAHEVPMATVAAAREAGVDVGHLTQSPYLNTIAAADEPAYPGDPEMEARIRDTLRWNAMMMVTARTSTSAASAATSPRTRASPPFGRLA